MAKRYVRINFENKPSHDTPLSAENLNKLDKGIDDIDTELEDKLSKTTDILNSDTTGGVDKVASAEVVKVHGQEIDTLVAGKIKVQMKTYHVVFETADSGKSIDLVDIPTGTILAQIPIVLGTTTARKVYAPICGYNKVGIHSLVAQTVSIRVYTLYI